MPQHVMLLPSFHHKNLSQLPGIFIISLLLPSHSPPPFTPFLHPSTSVILDAQSMALIDQASKYGTIQAPSSSLPGSFKSGGVSGDTRHHPQDIFPLVGVAE
jgi:hypothetical protein